MDQWYGVVALVSAAFAGLTSLVYTTCVGVRRSRCTLIRCGRCALCLREAMNAEEMRVDGEITRQEGEQRLREPQPHPVPRV